MFSRAVTRPALITALGARSALVPVAGFHASAAPQASLRELEARLKSVKNIKKITKSMMMIASTRLGRAQRAMNAAVAFGDASEEVYKQSEVQVPEGGKQLFIVVSSDKGLCGGIHSSVSKRTRSEVAQIAKAGGESPSVVVLGEKAKGQLSRAMPQNLALSFNQIGKGVPTYDDALAITDTIMKSGIEFDKINIIYNKYVSSISFESTVVPVYSENALLEAPKFGAYEMEEGTAKDLAEFSFTNAVFAALVEGHASEINSKRNAMDNASKNAGDMITNLNLLYNRGRQATITNELIDIITGASSL
ncbi:unnamed protein product [Malassezia sympodialis ATCC 42132]|uniref:ATP synthase subunit gamma n=1 Tax=Malassezia sympodialis (strain ATCC 42132) TaxID=1230383 RepID=M5EB35_MALS4|nr:uncharacterized protein MSY001_2583 [Malassezia sympodialis ATCC 42132]CCU99877.1 unnamed protein product [Malassezia sympodialis ATCC 42132]SHO76598.1 Similar to S.cerevisiae protein ATP3 (Gamma subunit of the F1 sector of mitochondrial F1F0 ATP synthase) [Malassezia sympodialis ATCC 42132]|eukprot:XP_018741104.1 uncharacterized protein MSY001_2583 [Malassezia sympodialis ATCC 42132]